MNIIDTTVYLLGIYHYIIYYRLINERSSNFKYGYVLDGYPMTVDQAEKIFNNKSSTKQININKLPG